MAVKHIVHCRYCKKEIDIDSAERDIDYVMPSKGWYYHKECWDKWQQERKVVKKNIE